MARVEGPRQHEVRVVTTSERIPLLQEVGEDTKFVVKEEAIPKDTRYPEHAKVVSITGKKDMSEFWGKVVALRRKEWGIKE